MFRTLLDLGILLSLKVCLTFLAVGGCLVLVDLFKPLPFGRLKRFSTSWHWVAGGSALIFVGIGVWYLGTQGFAGEVEPLVSSLSWLWQEGLPLYHNLNAPSQYSILYGPSVFLTNGLFLKILGPTLFSAKLASFLGALASLLFIHASLSRRKHDPLAAGAVLAAILLYWAHGFGIYLVRPDSLLVFSTGMGVYLAVRSRPVPGAFALAALLGFAVNLKVHGAFYFIPILYLARSRWGWKWLAVSVVGAVPLILLPFMLFPSISLGNYILWLKEAGHHGLVTTALPLTLRYAFLLLLPWVALLAVVPDAAAFWRRERGAILALLAALAPVMVIAAKPGAGPVHLMPLVPVMVVMAGVAVRRIPSGKWENVSRRAAIRSPGWALAAGVTLLLAGSVSGYRSTRLVAWELGNASDVAQELRDIMTDYDGLTIAMACGGENASFRETWVRPLLVFASQPVLIDPISVMDRCRAGRPLSPATYEAMKSGRVQLWLVPRGQTPFVKANWYPPHEQIFPASFRTAFARNYVKRGHTAHFDLWFWKAIPSRRAGDGYVSAGGANTGVMAPAK